MARKSKRSRSGKLNSQKRRKCYEENIVNCNNVLQGTTASANASNLGLEPLERIDSLKPSTTETDQSALELHHVEQSSGISSTFSPKFTPPYHSTFSTQSHEAVFCDKRVDARGQREPGTTVPEIVSSQWDGNCDSEIEPVMSTTVKTPRFKCLQSCAVKTCDITSNNIKQYGHQFISFPEDETAREKWVQLIGVHKGTQLRFKTDPVVCSKHFRTADFQDSILTKETFGVQELKRLKTGAVPTLHIPYHIFKKPKEVSPVRPIGTRRLQMSNDPNDKRKQTEPVVCKVPASVSVSRRCNESWESDVEPEPLPETTITIETGSCANCMEIVYRRSEGHTSLSDMVQFEDRKSCTIAHMISVIFPLADMNIIPCDLKICNNCLENVTNCYKFRRRIQVNCRRGSPFSPFVFESATHLEVDVKPDVDPLEDHFDNDFDEPLSDDGKPIEHDVSPSRNVVVRIESLNIHSLDLPQNQIDKIKQQMNINKNDDGKEDDKNSSDSDDYYEDMEAITDIRQSMSWGTGMGISADGHKEGNTNVESNGHSYNLEEEQLEKQSNPKGNEDKVHKRPSNLKGKEVKRLKKRLNMTEEEAGRCPVCKIYTAYMESHIVKEHGDPENPKVYRCTFENCGGRFLHRKSLSSHIRKCHHLRPFVCTDCALSFPDQEALSSHMCSGYKPEPRYHDNSIKCSFHPECDTICESKIAWKNHMRDVHELEKPFVCNVCDEGFAAFVLLDSHYTKNHQVEQTSLICSKCFRHFNNSFRLNLHVCEKSTRDRQLQAGQDIIDDRVVAQTSTTLTSATTVSGTTKSRQLHTNVRKRPRPTPPPPIKCTFSEHCKKQCTSESLLKRHIDHAHLGKSRYVCEFCGLGFEIEPNLKRHIVMNHGPELPCPQCSAAFKTNTILRNHMRTHSDPEFLQNPCRECPMTFRTPLELGLHTKNIHSDKSKAHNYECPLCQARLKRTSVLHHMDTVHPGNAGQEALSQLHITIKRRQRK